MTGNAQLYQIAQAQRLLSRILVAIFPQLIAMPVIFLMPGGVIDAKSNVTLLTFLLLAVTTLGCLIAMMIVTVWLIVSLNIHVLLKAMLIILLFVPAFNLYCISAALRQATRSLRSLGIKVGVFGVSKETLATLKPKPNVELVPTQAPPTVAPTTTTLP